MILRRILAATAPLSIVVGIVTACSSVPDVSFVDDDATDSGPNVLPDGAPIPDARTDVRDVSVDPNCVPKGPEVCDDGDDNDCNGLVDCEDPACQPDYQCVDRAPAGFELLGVADTRPACPTGYTDPADLEMFVGAPPSCECTCDEIGGTCTGGTADVTVSTEGSCTGGTTTTRALSRTQANCTAIPGGAIPVGNNNQRNERATAATQPSSCDPNVAVKLPAQLAGRTCKPPAKTGQGCPPTQVCVRKPTTGFALCAGKTGLTDGGATACVAPYVNRRRAGTSVTATPTCDVGACTCSNSACGGSITIFDTANCSAAGKFEAITTDDVCMAMAIGGGNWNAIAYRATSTGGCAPGASPAPQGTLDLANEQIICCK